MDNFDNYDLCFKDRGRYIDIVLSYKGTWRIISHLIPEDNCFPSRKDAFEFAKSEIGFTQTYEEVVNDMIEDMS